MLRQPSDHGAVFHWFLRYCVLQGPLGISSVTISSFAGIEYSDSTLLEAKHLLLALTSFVEDARAYLRGQLTCGPVGEDVLWER